MHAVLFDEESVWKNFLPLTFTRPVSELRIGILTIAEKWNLALKRKSSYVCQSYLAKKFAAEVYDDSVYINSAVCPDAEFLDALSALGRQEALYKGAKLLACYGDPFQQENKKKREYSGKLFMIEKITDLFTKNHEAILADFATVTNGRKSEKLSNTVTVIGDPSLVFLEEGVKAEACVFNTSAGPVYISRNAEVMEGCAIRGSFVLGEHSVVKMNAKIYGATTVGSHCKVGGEIGNSVIFGYSNKAHDGFLGNSVVGEWCNLGADTNNSNLKNNYGNVKLFNYRIGQPADTGLQFCGLIMGDHGKSGINTMFNTGTVAGVGVNIFGGGFPPTHIPSFSWGGSEGFEPYRIDKMFETATKVFERRGLKFDETEKSILEYVHRQTLQKGT